MQITKDKLNIAVIGGGGREHAIIRRLAQSRRAGKAPIGVAKLSKEYGKPVLAFSGCVTKDASACNAAGIDAFFPILRSVVSLEEAMDVKNAAENMADTVEQAFRLFLLQ